MEEEPGEGFHGPAICGRGINSFKALLRHFAALRRQPAPTMVDLLAVRAATVPAASGGALGCAQADMRHFSPCEFATEQM